MNDASRHLFIGTQGLHTRLFNGRSDQIPIYGVEVHHRASEIRLLTERHENKTEWLGHKREISSDTGINGCEHCANRLRLGYISLSVDDIQSFLLVDIHLNFSRMAAIPGIRSIR